MMRAMAKKRLQPDLSGLSHGEKDILILTLLARLDALESKVNKDSHNSSKPPSSDGLAKKTRSLRESSGKSVGGQVGHKGNTLKRAAEPTETVLHPLPKQCHRCQAALPLELARILERRQVFDVPAPGFDVIEHCTLSLVCACGQTHESAFPAEVTSWYNMAQTCAP